MSAEESRPTPLQGGSQNIIASDVQSSPDMDKSATVRAMNEYTEYKVRQWLKFNVWKLKDRSATPGTLVLDFIEEDDENEIYVTEPSLTFGCPVRGCTEPVKLYAVSAYDGIDLQDTPETLYGALGYAELEHAECKGHEGMSERWAMALGAKLPSEGAPLDFMRLQLEQKLSGGVQWLIPDVMETGKLASLFGPPGTGKSLLALEWAVKALRDGKDVVYFDEENDPAELIARMQDMSVDLSALATSFHYYSFSGLHVDTEEGAQKIIELAENADLVIFDSWAKFFVGASQNDDAAANRAYNLTVKPLRKAGIGILRLDHTGHDEVTRPAGTVAKLADVDHNWQIKAKALDGKRAEVTLVHRKSRTGRGPNTINLIREVAPLRHVPRGQEGQAEAPEETSGDPVADLIAFMDEKGWPADWTVRTAREELKRVGRSARNEVLSSAMRQRKESGVTAS
jgi:hypothetical protein